MNILFFLTPKSDVIYIYSDYTVKQTLEVMEQNRYTSIPIVNRDGSYAGTITEGDLLWAIKRASSFAKAEDLYIWEVPKRFFNPPVKSTANIEDLIADAINCNYVPVVDDRGKFIGIITRREILKHIRNTYFTSAAQLG